MGDSLFIQSILLRTRILESVNNGKKKGRLLQLFLRVVGGVITSDLVENMNYCRVLMWDE
jgi:hypothetical protein